MKTGAFAMTTSSLSTKLVFPPETIRAMIVALQQVCNALHLDRDGTIREIVALRVIELAKRGEQDAIRLRDQLLNEVAYGAMGRTSR